MGFINANIRNMILLVPQYDIVYWTILDVIRNHFVIIPIDAFGINKGVVFGLWISKKHRHFDFRQQGFSLIVAVPVKVLIHCFHIQ